MIIMTFYETSFNSRKKKQNKFKNATFYFKKDTISQSKDKVVENTDN